MSIVHVLPVNDLRAHDETATCWCEPNVLDEGDDDAGNPARVIVHAALDGRERHERQN